jgi:hypothetical protein
VNVLLITHDPKHAGLIGSELATFMPELHLDVYPAIPAVADIPPSLQAVVLDAPMRQGNPVAFLKELRSQGCPIVILVLAGPADLDLVAEMMEAGADDYVIKRTGFVAALYSLLSRLCGREQAPKLLYITEAAAGNRAVRSAPSPRPATQDRRDFGGATRFLLREAPEIQAPRGNRGPEPAPPDPALAEQLRVAQTERALLEENLRSMENRLSQQAEEFLAERQRWERWRAAVTAQLAAVDQSRAAIEEIVREENARQELLEMQIAELGSRVERSTKEMKQVLQRAEEESARLRAELDGAGARVAAEAERFRVEKEEWESSRRALEEHNRNLEARAAMMEQSEQARAEREQILGQLQNELRGAKASQEDYRRQCENSAAELQRLQREFDSLKALAHDAVAPYEVLLKRLRTVEPA